MTALPDHGLPPHLLTMREFRDLPEDNSIRLEIQEGVPIVTPRPRPAHQHAMLKLAHQLEGQLPDDLVVLIEVDVDLDLDELPTVRVPDVIVARRAAVDYDDLVMAEAVVIAVEIISPGSRRTDTVTKPSEYADAQIPHYWVVDLDGPVSLASYHLAGPFGYQETPAVTSRFTTSEPLDLELDLDVLRPAAPRE